MSFQQGLSGLNATSKSLEVIGNNIANSGTYGAKSSRAEFADFYAASLNGSTANGAGIGVYLANISQQFTQGSITATDNPLDIAVNGRGFFQVSDGASPTKYTRNGQFKLDREGYIVNNGGLKLLGYDADLRTGQIKPGLAVPIKLPTGVIDPRATDEIRMQLNLDATKKVSKPATGPDIDFTDSTTYNNATSLTIYDVKGSPVALTYYFQRSSGATPAAPTAPDVWEVFATANGLTVLPAGAVDNSAPAAIGSITFDPATSKPSAFTPGAGFTGTIDPTTNAIEIGFGTITGAANSSGLIPQPISGIEMTMDI
ncbi:MAG: flagellar hook-basal body complex protein, partial [Rubrivivax sp.]|nr:flagellar hook-basal body complex protein [Rubrivivax sp.]